MAVLGGWNLDEIKGCNLPQKAQSAFTGAMSDLVGADYEPICYLGSQQVNGTNYRILATKTPVVPNGEKSIVKIYVPAKVNTLADNLEVPESMRSWIEQIALSYYKKDYATAEGLMQQCETVLAGREIPRFENTTPAQTLGVRAAQ